MLVPASTEADADGKADQWPGDDGRTAMRTPDEHAVATAIIALMRGVVYRSEDETAWTALDRHGPAVRDHFAAVGVEVIADDAYGYAYLKTRPQADGEEPLPRLVPRRTLPYNLSLLLVLLRKQLAEFENAGGDGQLVLSRDQIVDMLARFLGSPASQARVIDQVDMTIRRATEMGFMRPLPGSADQWEVRRILKAYVDAQTLSDFAGKLASYAGTTSGTGQTGGGRD